MRLWSTTLLTAAPVGPGEFEEDPKGQDALLNRPGTIIVVIKTPPTN